VGDGAARPVISASDVVSALDVVLDFLTPLADRDWSAPVPDLDWNCEFDGTDPDV
jgi:hypothetical protein